MGLFDFAGRKNKLQELEQQVKAQDEVIARFTNHSTDIQVERFGSDFFYKINQAGAGNAARLHELFKEIPEISAPIKYYVDSIAGLPLMEVNKSTGKEVKDSKVIALINSPNQFQRTRYEFIKSALINLFVSNAFINKVGAPQLIPQRLYVLDPTTTKPVFSKEKDVRYRELMKFVTRFPDDTKKTDIDADMVYHMTNEATTYKELMKGGISVVQYLARVLISLQQNYNTSDELAAGRSTLIWERNNQNAPRFEGEIVNRPNQAGDDQKTTSSNGRRIEGALKKYGHGNTQRGAIAYSSRELGAMQLGFSPDQLGIMPLRDNLFLKCCMVVNVDPILLGNPTASTYNNKVEAAKQFWQNGALTTADNFAAGLSELIGLEKTMLKFDFSGIEALKNDRKQTFDMYESMYNNGLATGNEVRQSAGANPDPNYDNVKPDNNDTED